MSHISDEQLKNLPYGPVTREVFDNLSNSFLDASRSVAHQVAAERGIRSGEALRLSFAEKVAQKGLLRAAETPAELPRTGNPIFDNAPKNQAILNNEE